MTIKVLTPAESRALTTLDRFRDMISLSSSHDLLVIDIITAVSDAVANYCNRVFILEHVMETLPIDHSLTVLLSRTPIVSVESLTPIALNGTASPSLKPTFIDNDIGIIAFSPNGSPPGWIEITYKGGYVLLNNDKTQRTLPFDIEQAALEWTKAIYLARTRDPAVKYENISDSIKITYQISNCIPSTVASLLRPWRRII